MLTQDHFIHQVYFWLNNPESREDYAALLEGLLKLKEITTIKHFHIGVPASTSRDVIDSSYQLSWLLVFDSKEEQDAYQEDPVHLHFVDTCKHLWKTVKVFDSIGAYHL